LWTLKKALLDFAHVSVAESRACREAWTSEREASESKRAKSSTNKKSASRIGMTLMKGWNSRTLRGRALRETVIERERGLFPRRAGCAWL